MYKHLFNMHVQHTCMYMYIYTYVHEYVEFFYFLQVF